MKDGGTLHRWAALWHSHPGGVVEEHFLMESCEPMLFTSRQAAKDYIKRRYGYIAIRKDLRVEPHCWRVPRAVRVKITLEIVP